MIIGHYNPSLVALSIAVAIIASYTALDLANRVSEHIANRRRAWTWLSGGAAAMGCGIWSMHFIGMLAFNLPIPMAYSWSLTALSLVIAVSVSAVALYTLRSPTVPLLTLTGAASLMGIGISAMHYTGMMAMRMFPPIHYDPVLFAASVMIAMLASVAALWIAVALRKGQPQHAALAKLGSSVVMGCAIAGMHYTGMAAAQFAQGSVCLAAMSSGLGGDTLAIMVGCIAMVLMALMLVLATFDRHFAKQNALLAQSLQLAKDAAEAALRENRTITQELAAAQGQLLTAARKAGMAEIATSVLHNVGNVLNSVSVSAGLIGARVRESKLSGVLQSIDLLDKHATDITSFLTVDPKGQRLLPYLSKLAPIMSAERDEVLRETASLLKSIEHIKEIVTTQQSYAGSAVVASRVDVQDLLEDALRMNAASLNRHGIAIVRDFDAFPDLLLDKHLLLQILVNLIGNANQAMQAVPERAHVLTVRARFDTAKQPALRISVQDDGEGIAPENLSRLFTHGFTTRKTGHGFGLHSSALAAKSLGGTLEGASAGPGQGAIFTVELPANPVAAQVHEEVAA